MIHDDYLRELVQEIFVWMRRFTLEARPAPLSVPWARDPAEVCSALHKLADAAHNLLVRVDDPCGAWVTEASLDAVRTWADQHLGADSNLAWLVEQARLPKVA